MKMEEDCEISLLDDIKQVLKLWEEGKVLDMLQCLIIMLLDMLDSTSFSSQVLLLQYLQVVPILFTTEGREWGVIAAFLRTTLETKEYGRRDFCCNMTQNENFC